MIATTAPKTAFEDRPARDPDPLLRVLAVVVPLAVVFWGGAAWESFRALRWVFSL